MITKFSEEVIKKLDHYVYRLVDPTTGQTFYVGEGCGNRVFAHANAVDMNFYKSDVVTDQDKKTENDDDPAKIRKIMEIKSKNLSVIHIIQRWGMSQETAYEVEAAFIDYFGLQSLTNKVKGHNQERGMRLADELEKELTAEAFDDYPNSPKFVLIKITDYSINQSGGNNALGIYRAVRGTWVLDPKKANNYEYVLAVNHGIVVGVYKIKENGWRKCSDSNRSYFDGYEAPEDIKNLFMGKKIPEKYKKRQNPAGYCD